MHDMHVCYKRGINIENKTINKYQRSGMNKILNLYSSMVLPNIK